MQLLMHCKTIGILFLVGMASSSTCAATETVNGVKWTYTVVNGEASVGGGTSSSLAVPGTTTGAITIPETIDGYPVTSIGDYAFYNCSGLTSVTIPNSVTHIGDYAFKGCSDALFDTTRITGVKLVDGWAVGYEYSLSGSLILTGVRGIGSMAFYSCSWLTSVTIPSSVTSIGGAAFGYCSGLTSITVDPNNPVFDSRDNCNAIVTTSSNELILGCKNTTIPGSVTRIGDYAFKGCSRLTSITIPDGVTSIGNYAFYGCSGLTSVTIPDSVTSIEGHAFYGCSGLTSVTIPDSVTSIEDHAFEFCSGLTSVTIPDSVTSIGYAAFSGSGLTAITIPDSVTSIEEYAFEYCAALTNAVMGNRITNIKDATFRSCSGLTSITIPDSVTNIEAHAFEFCSGLISVTIPDSVTSIGGSAFYGCSGLTNAVIGNSVTSIGDSAFCNCTGLTSVTIPDVVTSIGGYAFSSCSGLTNAVIGNSVMSIGGYAFSGCSGLTSITIPDGVMSIGDRAFYGCAGLTSITIPDGVTSIGDYAFSDCSGLTNAVIGNSVMSIGGDAFSCCSGLTSITIPDSVMRIGDDAFYGCSGLTNAMIGNGVTSIGTCAFRGCSGLQVVNISDLAAWCGVSFSSSEANPCYHAHRLFLNGEAITNLVIPDGVGRIKSFAFESCTELESIAIPDSVTGIEDSAFPNNQDLFDTASIPGVRLVDGWAVGTNGIPAISGELLLSGVRGIGDNAFKGCGRISSVTIQSGAKAIGDYAFHQCSGLASVSIPNTVAYFGDYAFAECGQLSSVKVPSSVREIGDSCFSGCKNLASVTMADGVTRIGKSAFAYCSKIKSLFLPRTLVSIGNSAFWGWDAITYMSVPQAVLDQIAPAFGEKPRTNTNGNYCAIPTGMKIVVVNSSGHSTELIYQAIPSFRPITTMPTGTVGEEYRVKVLSSKYIPGQHSFELASNSSMPVGLSISEDGWITGIPRVSGERSSKVWDVISNSVDNLNSFWFVIDPFVESALEDGPWKYRLNNGDSIITRCTLDSGAVEIPSILGGHPVRSIEPACIGDVDEEGVVTNISVFAKTFSAGITSVTIPESVKNIGAGAFAGASGLVSVNIPNSVTNIGPFAFTDCSNLASVSIGSGVRTISDGAFSHCPVLDDVSIPDTVVETGVGVFQDCRGLKNVSLGSGRTYVGMTMFKDCTSLERISIPSCVTNILGGAFWNCSNLVEPMLPSSVTSIGNEAFRGCSSLRTFSSPAALRLLGERAFAGCISLSEFVPAPDTQGFLEGTFAGCTSLGEIVMPQESILVGREAFFGCTRLTNIVWNGKTEAIDEWAFGGCSGLESVSVPDSVSAILPNSFWGCTNLVRMELPFCGASGDLGTASQLSCFGSIFGEHPFEGCAEAEQTFSWDDGDAVTYYLPSSLRSVAIRGGKLAVGAFSGCWTLEEVSILDCASDIPDLCFLSCESMRSVSLPEGVESIGSGAFALCPGLRSVHLPSSLSQIGASAFLQCDALTNVTYGPGGGGVTLSSPVPAALRVAGMDPEEGRLVLSVDSPDERDRVIWSDSSTGEALGFSASASVRLDDTRSIVAAVVPISIAALDSENIRISDPDGSPWALEQDETAVGGYCLRSGSITTNATSSVETALVGPGTLSFRWKISANRGDSCTFYLDGTETRAIETRNGTMTAWETVTLAIPAGQLVARWSYQRGSGSAAGEDAAFLDDVDWRPELSLSVASTFGSATPAVGAHTFVYGDEVTASVEEPAAANGTRRVCTGWTGTGSVPETGSGDSVSFVIKEASSLTWNWRTEHWIDVSVSGAGSTDFSPRWVAEGETVSVDVSPSTHLFRIDLSGDTAGASLSGTVLSFPADGPRTIRISVEETKLSLDVASEHGEPSPAIGRHSLSWGTVVRAGVADPEPTNGIAFVCTGWNGTGSVPESGDGTKVSFELLENSTLTWTWKTNILIRLVTDGAVEAEAGDIWAERNSTASAAWTPTAEYFVPSLSGDTDGVVLDEANGTLAIPADRPRTVVLSVRALTIPGALDGQGLRWTTDGAARWFPQAAETLDGEDAAQSGRVLGDGVSALETTVSGPGTFSWSWKISAAGNAGVDVLLDGTWRSSFAPSSAWSSETLEIEDGGNHTIRFEFWNAGTAATIGDSAYLDQVSWTGDVPGGRETQTTPVPVPFPWLDGYDLAEDGDYESAAAGMASNGVNRVWQCYVAGLNPTGATNRFLATIDLSDGAPDVKWSPDLGDARRYIVEGKTNLVDKAWGPTNEATRFFRVKVTMP